MNNKAVIGAVLVAVVLMGLPLAWKAKQGTGGHSADITPARQKQMDVHSPVEISPDQFKRLKYMTSLGSNASLAIFPVRVNAVEEDAASASDLAKLINDAGLCKAAPAKQSLLLKPSPPDPNEMNNLFFMAREFRDYAKKNPPDTDYVLYADYFFFPNSWNLFTLHFVVCDRQGEWVIVDLQNSDLPDFQSINPKSKEDCNKLLVKRLKSYLRDQATVAATSAATAEPPMDPTEADKVLDKLLGNWNGEKTIYAPGTNPAGKRVTYRGSVSRVLGGRFVQETCVDSENNSSLGLRTYDQQRKCFRAWFFSSDGGGPDVPQDGRWNGADNTLDWTVTTKEYSMACPARFVNDDLVEAPLAIKDMSGNTTFRAEFKISRMKGAQNPNQPAPEVSWPGTGTTPEQKVLDRFLGNWTWDVTIYGPASSPEEKHSTGRSSFTRVLSGNFVQETGEDSEQGASLVFYTYDQRRECYLFWVFLSKYGGPDAPSTGKWNEATRAIDWAFTNAEGQSMTSQHRFMSDNAFEFTALAKDTAGKTLWRQEFKFTRVKD